MEKLYDRIYWHNNTTPAINETNLNSMSKAIDDIDDRVIELAADIMVTVPALHADLEEVAEIEESLQALAEKPPYIGANGDWYIWDTNTRQYVDSGIDASIAVTIADITMLDAGATPYVTNTGTSTDPVFHLFIPRGLTGKTAYQSAVDGGYTGTEADFNTELATLPSYSDNAEDSALDAEAYAVGKRNGVDVPSTDETYHNNSKYYSGLAGDSETNALAYKNAASQSATDAQTAATAATNAKSQISEMINMTEFSVNFTTGNLEYTNDSTYSFNINTTTGNLEWEVIVA